MGVRTESSKFRVVVIESERGWGRRVDSIEYFDTAEQAWAFEKRFNSNNPVGPAPDWYMQAEDPEQI